MLPSRGGSRRLRPGTIRATERRPRTTSMKSSSDAAPAPAQARRTKSPVRVPTPTDKPDHNGWRDDDDTTVAVVTADLTEAVVPDSTPEDRKSLRLRKLLDDDDANIALARELCWTGIPQKFRATLWLMLMGIIPTNRSRREQQMRKRIEEYRDFLNQAFRENLFTGEQTKSLVQIDLDLPRTSPGLQLFHLPIVQQSLRNVLCVYSIRHPATGYVQGMNDLVTPFFYVFISDIIGPDKDPLLIAPEDLDESQWMRVESYSFWCLSRLMEGIQDHYTRDQPGIQWKLVSLEHLMGIIDPRLNEHLASQEVQYSFFAYRWMNCFLMRELSLPLIVRLWDTYFSEEKGFAGFHVFNMDMEHILSTLQNDPTSSWTEADLTAVLSHAFVLRSQHKLVDSPSSIAPSSIHR
ncbi:hypothetical protein PBRA_004459 [Plasmodiophora brassicae]|uniref:Rab-GAP TBC domain-containing protein n=1 Tax=Plasmodiophora brassicae TaxID=37360 RepID=A0A0G4IKG2_PLABS|nr:hypothetical protein PBRA_004459 [Plasmodiophora brassicae]